MLQELRPRCTAPQKFSKLGRTSFEIPHLIATFILPQHSEPESDYAPPYGSPIASQKRALISDSVKDNAEFEECEPLTQTGIEEVDEDLQPSSNGEKTEQHRHTKAPLHMMASRGVCLRILNENYIPFYLLTKDLES